MDTETSPEQGTPLFNPADAGMPPAGSPNGKADRIIIATQDVPLNDAPCADCGPSPSAMGRGLGLVICAVAGALAFIGIDLATGGALSRRLGAADELEQDD
jgi:hypothetical protein